MYFLNDVVSDIGVIDSFIIPDVISLYLALIAVEVRAGGDNSDLAMPTVCLLFRLLHNPVLVSSSCYRKSLWESWFLVIVLALWLPHLMKRSHEGIHPLSLSFSLSNTKKKKIKFAFTASDFRLMQSFLFLFSGDQGCCLFVMRCWSVLSLRPWD